MQQQQLERRLGERLKLVEEPHHGEGGMDLERMNAPTQCTHHFSGLPTTGDELHHVMLSYRYVWPL